MLLKALFHIQCTAYTSLWLPECVVPHSDPLLNWFLPSLQALECSVHEAHAANAAVAAVAQVLASKQAAALCAREAAGAATKRLRRFMAELDTQVGGQGWPTGKRSSIIGDGSRAELFNAAARYDALCCRRSTALCPTLMLPSCPPRTLPSWQFGIQSKLSSRPAPLSPCKPAGLASPCVPSVLPSAAPLSPVAPLMAPQLLAAPALEGCSL